MMAPARPAVVRFYVDADVLGLARVLADLRNDVTYPGDPGKTIKRRHRPACVITDPGEKDPVWIPVTAREGWLIITRDRHIQDRPAELHAVREYGARMVALAGREATDTWAQLEVVMSNWRAIEALTERSGPFIVSATRTSLRDIPLI